jgi:3-oxoacyl-[acyl-carrier-protein] synthase-3
VKAITKGIKIAGINAAIPENRHSYMETPEPFTIEETEKLYKSIGVYERRILPPHLCASDMCVGAAEQLLKNLNWDPATVEVLIFVSQDSDYVLPSTACLIQTRLGLPETCAAFDVNLGCSGFVYATWMASQLLTGSNGKRALVLCGDTSTRYLNPNDRSTLPLFGDAGSAVALEKDENSTPIYTTMGTDGRGAANILVEAGGRRLPLVPEAEPWSDEKQKELFEKGRLHLNGAEVFAFSLRSVPKLVANILDHADVSNDDINWCVMHQANAFMLKHLRKKTKFPEEKFIIDLEKFGNTSSASIPLAIAHQLADDLSENNRKVLLAGFGVGWSWGAMVLDIGAIPKPEVVEIKNDFPPLQLYQQVKP